MNPKRLLLALLVLIVLALVAVFALDLSGEDDVPGSNAPYPQRQERGSELLRRGEYLARAGNCMACHTARGGAPWAGGLAIETPFGTVYASNLTPDDETGLGRWSADDFWRAMHFGRSADGRLLYPAFPYPNYTQVTREDADAIHAYLRSLPPVRQPNRPHELRFPFSTQWALAGWRLLFFRPGRFEPDPQRSAEWNRGAYLVRGLGHCNACHGPRNAFGATRESLEFGGGLIPMQNWYAPALNSPREAGVAHWELRDVVALLKTGVAPQGSALGPMAEVVFRSTQYLDEADLRAIAVFLKELPQAPAAPRAPVQRADAEQLALGARLYGQHCAGCHGEAGQGAPGAYPALAGNRAVTMDPPANLLRAVLAGGFPPATAGNPRPYGMPPFAPVFDDVQLAALLTYLRQSWGNEAAPLSPLDVLRHRQGEGRP
ncbi:cytochrome c [Caldimonas tepidiphila]|uniref:cytochrome c n=1 Tax=Caldimonas tepidiphila TaxID=2315841 RepID=UPI000E5B5BC9|nr:cytochrome c [Caldimonas tepidiphila]